MCKQCHAEAPNVADAEFMWVWLRAHWVPFYGMYWYERGLREYEFLFKKKPLGALAGNKSLCDRLMAAVAVHIRKTSAHWGQGRINPATIAWLILKAETEIMAELEACAG